MNAGRELDALVAERVMGLPVKWGEDPYREIGMPSKEGRQPHLKGRAGGVEYDWAPVPRYSTDIAAAWQVVEHLATRPPYMAVEVSNLGVPHARVIHSYGSARFQQWEAWVESTDIPDPRPFSERCALAICLAALRATGWEAPDAP